MKKSIQRICVIIALTATISVGLLAGCGNTGDTQVPGSTATEMFSPAPDSATTEATTPASDSTTAEATTPAPMPSPLTQEEIDNVLKTFPTSEYPFVLTDAEKALLQSYKDSNYDVTVFKDATQIQIGKVYIECGVQGDAKGEFYLYSDEGLQTTLEQRIKENADDIASTPIQTRQNVADINFAFLDQGQFSQTDDSHGKIQFKDTLGEDMVMNFVKNGDGVWLVRYDPFGK